MIFYHLRMFYLLPWVVYFLLSFFEKRKAEFFWLASIVTMLWLLGNPPYFLPIWIFLFFVFLLPFFFFEKGFLKCLRRNSPRISALIVFLIVLSLSYFYQCHQLSSFADINVPSREHGLRNSLGVFLAYGKQEIMPAQYYFNGLFLGEIPEMYLGLFLLAMLIWAIVNVKKRIFRIFLSTAIIFIWLSFSGVFAMMCYLFPALPYYRHIDALYLGGIIKMFLAISAGFGCEVFWTQRWQKKAVFLSAIAVTAIFLLDAYQITGQGLFQFWMRGHALKNIFAQLTDVSSVFFRVSVYFVGMGIAAVFGGVSYFCRKTQRRTLISDDKFNGLINVFLIGILILDVFSFQFAAYKKAGKVREGYEPFLYVFRVHKPVFQEQRRRDPILMDAKMNIDENKIQAKGNIVPIAERQNAAFEILTAGYNPNWKGVCSDAYGFCQFDTCRPQFTVHFKSRRTGALLEGQEDISDQQISAKALELYRIIGCNFPKLRLVSQALPAQTQEDARDKTDDVAKLHDIVVLRGLKQEALPSAAPDHPADTEGKIAVTEFTADTLEADVDVKLQGGAWFVYADSYHPGWHASVNGKKTTVYEANLAFKAIHLDQGKNKVRFAFYTVFGLWASYFIAVFGLAASLVFLAAFLRILFGKDGLTFS